MAAPGWGDGHRLLADGGEDRPAFDYRTLFRAIEIPTIVLDAEGNVVVWNDAEADLVGVTREQVTDRDGRIGEELYDGGRTTILAEKVLAHPHDAHEVYDTVRLAEDDYSLLVGDEAPVFEDYSTVDVSGEGVWFIATAVYDDDELAGVVEFTQSKSTSGRRTVEVDRLVEEVSSTLRAYQEGDFGARASLDREFYITEEELVALVDRTNELGASLERMAELRRTKERLEELNTRLELALEETDTGVWEWDLETDEVFWDEASERLFGYEKGASPGTYDGFADRVLDEDLSGVERRIERAIESGDQYQADFRIRLPDGELRWLQSRGIVEYDDGEPVRMLGVQTDITTRKRFERALEERNRKLELVNQTIRHDIRNDMAVILAQAELLEGAVTDERGHRLLGSLRRYAEHAVELTENVRDLMATMLGPDDETVPVALGPVLDAELDTIRANDEVAVEAPAEPPDVAVLADDMLGTVFRNLLNNAVQHNAADRPELRVSVDERDAEVVVRVADNGPGIPEDRRQEIFGRGEKGLESAGTGLGLYLVDTLVERYGGGVRVEDSDAGGAAFVVTLRKAGSRDPGDDE